MFILGHTGITLGAAALLNGALLECAPRRLKQGVELSPQRRVARGYPAGRLVSWFALWGNRIDIRLLLIGSLLPDIIDKPVGQLLFRETFSNGRIFCHTLLFLTLITLAGFFLYRSYSRTWLLALSFGTFAHLILDQMWLEPQTVLWPLYGLAFVKIDLTDWAGNIFHAILTNPAAYIPEIVGGVILILFACMVVRSGKLIAFIRSGKL